MKKTVFIIDTCLLAFVCGTKLRPVLVDFSIDNLLDFMWPFLVLLLIKSIWSLYKERDELIVLSRELISMAEELIEELKKREEG